MLLLGQTNKPKFSISINYYYGASGYHQNYFVTQDSLKLITDFDFVGYVPKTKYSLPLKKYQVIAYYNQLIKLRIDTLQDIYDPYQGHINDGTYYVLKVSGEKLPNKEIKMNNYAPESVKSIMRATDKLIKKKKYRHF
jgi:hypothetical protein